MTSALPPTAPPPAADQPAGSWPPPPPPTAPAPRPQLRRSRTDRVIGGVAGGLAEYTGVDALLWRVGAIALTFAAGSSIVVYGLLWLLMPAAPALPAGPDGTPAGEPARARPRSAVPGVTVAALLILGGVAALLDGTTDVDLGGRGFLGIALLVVGIGLVVGAVTGVGRGAKSGLIVLGVILSVALVLVSTVSMPNGEWGDRTYRPTTAAAVEPVYEHGAGDFVLDLSEIDLADAGAALPITTRIDHGLGDLEVVVPLSADVRVSLDHGVGEAEVLGDSTDEGFFPGLGSAEWTGDRTAEIVLTIDAGLGDVEVSRG